MLCHRGRDAGGAWGQPAVPEAFGTDGIEAPEIVAAGPAGILVAGRPDGRPALPGVGASGQRAEAVTWLGDHPVVVGSAGDDPQRGAVVWWGVDGTGEWLRLAGSALGGPGRQEATGIASDGDTVVIVGTAPQGGAVWRAPVPA